MRIDLFTSRLSPKMMAVIIRQLATLMSAGIPLVSSLEIILQECEVNKTQKMLREIKNFVEAGGEFSLALAQFPEIFNELTRGLIYAGEKAGVLEVVLLKIADQKEKMEAMKMKVKKALFYPCLVFLVAMSVSLILLLYVVPQFIALFHSFGATLPALTQTVVGLSEILQNYGKIIFSILILIIISGIYLKRRYSIKSKKWDKLLLQVPFLKTLLQHAIIARLIRALALAYHAGLPLVQAMSLIANTAGNQLYFAACFKIRDEIAVGEMLHKAMRKTKMFPTLIVQMIAIGEQSGSLDNMLFRLADIYEAKSEQMLETWSHLLEPVMMVILGMIVGGLVIAMYLPIFRLGTVV